MIAPNESGISAATGERKTSSRTISRIGRAISSLRSEAAIDSSWIALERVAKPVWVALTGVRHLLFEHFVEFVDRVADRVVHVDVEVGEDQRLVRGRAQVADFALVPGRDRRHLRFARFGAGAQRVDQFRALFFDLRAWGPGAGSRRAPSRRSTGAAACWRLLASVPGTSSEVGLSLLSTSRPKKPRTTIRSSATTSVVRGRLSDSGRRFPVLPI